MLRLLYPQGNSHQYPLDRRLRGLQSWSGYGGKEKKSYYCPCWELNRGHPAHSLISVLSEKLLIILWCLLWQIYYIGQVYSFQILTNLPFIIIFLSHSMQCNFCSGNNVVKCFRNVFVSLVIRELINVLCMVAGI
jgi:hypothetical protein